MQQMPLFQNTHNDRIVNVASVPQLSPFRYPGGKTWLVPYIRRWLASYVRQELDLHPVRPAHFIEPFAGGGIVSLTVAAEKLADHVTMIEIDEDIASVWQTIFNEEDGAWLTREMVSFDLTRQNVEALLERTQLPLKERAFRTLVRNRVNRGGILAPGAGLIKDGENGKGIKSRWYPATLATRIQNIVKLRDQITFIAGDGTSVLEKHLNDPDAVFFIDPPYTVAGKKAGTRLYRYSEVDHAALFEIASRLRGDFLMTYDDVKDVRELAARHDFEVRAIPMKNTHHARNTELLIGRNLAWLRFL
ncbi:MAG: DNA adenine methylase [Ktedonobacteraceae bacterium]